MNPTATMLAGMDELGCGVVPIPNGMPGQVMQINPSGQPVWGLANGDGAGGTQGVPATVVTAFAAGVLTVTVGSASSPIGVSASVNLRGQLLEDTFGADLGYLLPL
jgi:hypothetical protein